MPDSYGDVTMEDLERLQDFVVKRLDMLAGILSKLMVDSKYATFYDAKVISHCTKGSDEEKAYGYGAISIAIPQLFVGTDLPCVWASPHRVLQGRFEVPPLNSWVRIVSQAHSPDMFEYYGAMFLDREHLFEKETSEENVGYGPAASGGSKGTAMTKLGPYVDKVRTNPSTMRIIESSNNFLIFEDATNKVIEIRAADNWKVEITTGNNSNIQLKAGATAVEKSVLGDTLKAKLDAVIDAITAHNHGALGGSPPLNSASFTSIKAQLSTILSPKVKNN